MKAQLSTILRYFKITTNMKMEDLDFDLDIVFRNLRGYWVKLERRSWFLSFLKWSEATYLLFYTYAFIELTGYE